MKDAAEAQEFKTHFEAAKAFNLKAKNGDTDLVMADAVDDIKEVADNPDENVAHEDE
jgi:hypothetical protein